MKKILFVLYISSLLSVDVINAAVEEISTEAIDHQQYKQNPAMQELAARITKLEEKDIIGISFTAGTFILGVIAGLVAMHIIHGKKSHGHVLGGK